jgi:hypothetical protein
LTYQPPSTLSTTILLSRLSTAFGITGPALSFLSSNLLDRTQAVSSGPGYDQSAPSPLSTGVPQGSVLGPLLFCLYTKPLASILARSSITPNFYADDTQLHISFSAADLRNCLLELSSSALDLTHSWLTSNRLTVNPSKIEFFLIGTPQ